MFKVDFTLMGKNIGKYVFYAFFSLMDYDTQM